MESKDYIILNQLEKNIKNENNIFDNHFVLFIIGKPGSGKTTILEEMLLNPKLLNKKFDYLLIYSPSPLKELNLTPEEEKEIIIKEFNLDILFAKIEEINKDIKKKNINFLLVFDDFIANFKKKEISSQIMKLFFNRRHLLINGIISIILISQRYMTIPAFIRTCCNGIIFFKLHLKEYKALKEEHLSWMDMNKLNIDNDHDFLFINLTNGKCYKNFLK